MLVLRLRAPAAAPLGHEPGSYWYYSSGTTNILARIAGDALEGQGTNLPVFMQKELFEPLGVFTALTEVDSAGDFVGSSFGYMSAHDWARMGWFFLNEGRALDGRQLVSSDWLGFMTRDNGLSNGDYGAQIWLNRAGRMAVRWWRAFQKTWRCSLAMTGNWSPSFHRVIWSSCAWVKRRHGRWKGGRAIFYAPLSASLIR